jgi:hypothetical protein
MIELTQAKNKNAKIFSNRIATTILPSQLFDLLIPDMDITLFVLLLSAPFNGRDT